MGEQSRFPSRATGDAEATVSGNGLWHKHRFVIVLFALTTLGALLRAVHLNSTIACDEAVEMARVMQNGLYWVFHFPDTVVGATFHRLNAILAILSAKVFGDVMWAWRLPSYFLGVAVIPLIAILVRRTFKKPGTALIAATLATFSPILIAFSPTNRGYSSVVFFSIATAYLFLKVSDRPTILNALLLISTTVCLGISHMFALMLLGTIGCYAAVRAAICIICRKRFETWKLTGSCVALAGIFVGLVLALAIYSLDINIVDTVSSRVTTGYYTGGARRMSMTTTPLVWLTNISTEFFGCKSNLVPMYWFFIVAGAVTTVVSRSARRGFMFAFLVIPPIILCTLIGLAGRTRYFIFLLPFWHVLIANFLSVAVSSVGTMIARVLRIKPYKPIVFTSVVSVTLLCAVTNAPRIVRDLSGPGSSYLNVMWDCKAAADFLWNHVHEDDVILSFPLDPSKKSDYARSVKTRLFLISMRAHLIRKGLYSKTAKIPENVLTSRIWYVTPLKDQLELGFLPTEPPPQLAAEFRNCYVYSSVTDTPNIREVALAPFDLVNRKNPEWRLSRYSPASPKIAIHEAKPSTWNSPFVTVKIDEAGTHVGISTSRLIPAIPGRVVHVATKVSFDQPHRPYPQLDLDLRFYDDKGKRVAASRTSRPYSNSDCYDLDSSASEKWYPCRVSCVVPSSSRYLGIRMRLGGHSSLPGDMIRVLQPSLLVDWGESETLATVFRDFDEMPLPDDMSDFELLTIENADFRTEDGKVSGWSSHRYGGKVKYEACELEGVEHSRFIRVIVEEDETNWALYSEPVAVAPGSKLRLMADVSDVSSSTAVVMRFLDVEGKRIRDVYCFASRVGSPLVRGSRWFRISRDCEAPDHAAQVAIGLRVTERCLAGDTFIFRPVSLSVKE